MKTEAELHALEPERLDAVAGAIDWRAAAQMLQAAIGQRSAIDTAWFIISPPSADYASLLEAWAMQQHAVCIPSPAYEIVLGDHSGWLADLPQAAGPWTLPRLERCWLRHPAGLDLVRDLFDRLLSGRLGFGLIGCDSWAWAYLRHVVPTQTVHALTLQALDGERLANCLGELAAGSAPDLAAGQDPCQRRFRHAQSGNLLLAVNDDDETAVSSELRHLAAQSRGNPGVALQLWRARLRSVPDKPKAAEGDAEADETDNDAEVETIWVAPARELELPSGLDEPEALILHALLLHDGLPTEVVEDLLPHTRFRMRTLLLQLATAEMLKLDPDGCWRVTPFAYAAVRGFLTGHHLLLDDL